MELDNILTEFVCKKDMMTPESFGKGHIHESYQVRSLETKEPEYFLQRFNHRVFPNIQWVTDNILTVTNHIQKKIDRGIEKTSETLKLIPTIDGQFHYQDEDSNYWRLFEYKRGFTVKELVEDQDDAFISGSAFGNFLRICNDLPPSQLHTTINRFHSLSFRIKQFDQAWNRAASSTKNSLMSERKLALSLAAICSELENFAELGKLTMRVVHNDTKLNNVLVNGSKSKVCVIDLDTVMPGIVHHDFGDGIRTAAATMAEDSDNIDLVDFNMDFVASFVQGYFEGAGDSISKTEKESLSVSCIYMPLIMSIRFLTDYLNGNVYYRVEYPKQNLVRAKNQLQLAKRANELQTEIEEVVFSK